MNKAANTIFIFAFVILSGFIFLKNINANTADIFIENDYVNGNIFTWEVHIQRTDEWTTDSLMNIIGSSSVSFNFNNSALTNPVILIDTLSFLFNTDYLIASEILRNKCIVDINFQTALLSSALPLNQKVLLFKMELTITDPSQTADLTWDQLNTGIFDNADGNVNLTYFGSSSIPLPVELSFFTASIINNRVKLEWSTETEQGNYGFEVERKTEEARSETWEKIGFVEGAGNSNSPKYYSFIDDNLNGGIDFSYRLKQIDNDGNYSYSDVIEVSLIVDSYQLMQNFPNPFNSATTIVYHLKEKGNTILKLYDVLGQQIKVLVDEELNKGIHRYELQTSDLASGVYLYSIEVNSLETFFDVKKMILLK